ncbi:MAG: DUF2283 domain-containing protein [Patescibacteria group bacterium]
MKKIKPIISYNKESKVLSVELKKAQSTDSELSGNVVIDYDKNGEAVRVNFYDFNFNDFKSNPKAFKGFAENLRVLAKA